ncbi:uncharacterized protein LOC121860004 isoform X1 [Homarus americanus]|nr:uncharacterized protein LOC121860004 isoform X1 [Homarus americanus]
MDALILTITRSLWTLDLPAPGGRTKTIFLVPDHDTQHDHQPVRGATAIRIPESVFGAKDKVPGGGAVENKGEESSRDEARHSFSDSNSNSFNDSALQTAPFSLPGSFVNTHRRRQEIDNVTYYYERPVLSEAIQNRRTKPATAKKDVPYYSERPPSPARNPDQRRRPTKPLRGNVVSESEFAAGHTHVSGQQRPINLRGDEINYHRKQPSEAAQGSNNRRRPVITARDNATSHIQPPLGLLNPKPNTWRGSGIDQTPSQRHSTIWSQNKSKIKDQSASTPPEDDANTNGDTTASSSSQEFYPTTLTPATSPTTSSAGGSGGVAASEDSDMPDYNDLSLFQLQYGVPINWIPGDKMNHS